MKIMIRATNWVGDAIMALPALRAVRDKFVDAHIAVVARPYVADIYREQRVCDQLIVYNPRGQHAGFSGRERLARDLRGQGFDVALLLQNAFDAAWLAWRAGIPKRIGYARDGRSLLLTEAIAMPKRGETPAHEQFYYLELLHRAGWIDEVSGQTAISLQIPEGAAARAERRVQAAGSRRGATRIAIGAGASYGSAKCWPPERFARVARALGEKFDAEAILFGTPAEAQVSSAIVSAINRPSIDLTGTTTIAELPAMLSRCHLFIGNDSGAMHVAAAVGLPVVAVFGPTDPLGTAPLTPRCTVVRQKPYCSPCFLRRCPTDHRCMTRVSPEEVQAAADYWMSRVEVRPA